MQNSGLNFFGADVQKLPTDGMLSILLFTAQAHLMNSPGRRSFLKSLLALAGIGLTLSWKKAMDIEEDYTTGKKHIVFRPDGKRYMLAEGVLLILTDNGPRAYDAHCTHLGCVLQVSPEGSIRCPCHGSEFSATGAVIRGPARNALIPFDVVSESNGEFVVEKISKR